MWIIQIATGLRYVIRKGVRRILSCFRILISGKKRLYYSHSNMNASSIRRYVIGSIVFIILFYFIYNFGHKCTYSWNYANLASDLKFYNNVPDNNVKLYQEPVNMLPLKSSIRAMSNEKEEMERLKIFLHSRQYYCTGVVNIGNNPIWNICVDSRGGIKLQKANIYSIRHSFQDDLSKYSLEDEFVQKYNANVKIFHNANISEKFEVPSLDAYTIHDHVVNEGFTQKSPFSLYDFNKADIDLLRIEILGSQFQVYHNLLYLRLLSKVKQLHLEIKIEWLPVEAELLYNWYILLYDTFTKAHFRMYSSYFNGSCDVNLLKDCYIYTSWAFIHNPLVPVIPPPAGLGTAREELIRYSNYILTPHILCPNKQIHGGVAFTYKENLSFIDGSWYACHGTKYSIEQKSCLVYSFGILNDWSFDEAMEHNGCEVYSFDPSIGLGNHKHSDNITFYKFGLAGKDEVWKKEGGSIWNMKTLATIVKHLGHENKVIDFLKFDIEGSEWEVFPNLFQVGILRKVNQVSFELHHDCIEDPAIIRNWYKLMFTFEMLGFSLFNSHQNPVASKMHSLNESIILECGTFLYELAWIKTRDVFSKV